LTIPGTLTITQQKENEENRNMNTTIVDIPKLLETAEAAAYEAGNYLIKKLGQAKVKDQKSSRDDLLDTDLEAENIILTRLRKDTPDIGILSEEAGVEGNQETYWITDPLDGSANFQHGSPTFAIAIALVIEQVTVGSIIYLPTRNEMFTAIQNQGAYLNKEPISVSTIAHLEEAITHVGDIMKEGNPTITEARTEDITKLLMHARRIRMIGTAATDLAYVACGRADILVNHAADPWDIEAGKLLVIEAGGKATTKPHHIQGVLSIYSNGIIHSKVENLLFP
jgi:myo-inositol-1(or 4)-monophosphatase